MSPASRGGSPRPCLADKISRDRAALPFDAGIFCTRCAGRGVEPFRAASVVMAAFAADQDEAVSRPNRRGSLYINGCICESADVSHTAARDRRPAQ